MLQPGVAQVRCRRHHAAAACGLAHNARPYSPRAREHARARGRHARWRPGSLGPFPAGRFDLPPRQGGRPGKKGRAWRPRALGAPRGFLGPHPASHFDLPPRQGGRPGERPYMASPCLGDATGVLGSPSQLDLSTYHRAKVIGRAKGLTWRPRALGYATGLYGSHPRGSPPRYPPGLIWIPDCTLTRSDQGGARGATRMAHVRASWRTSVFVHHGAHLFFGGFAR